MKTLVTIGDTYGRLRITRDAGTKYYPSGDTQRQMECRCECGKHVIVNLGCLRSGHTKSCGCFNSEVNAIRKTTHGMSKRLENRIYRGMKGRCLNRNNQDWKFYGGRGISIDPSWLGKEGFQNFYRDMGPRPSVGHSIDRIDTNKGYGPDNCRWATLIQQRRNQRNNRVIEFRGKKQCLIEWSIELGTKYKVLQERLADGWTVERAFTTSHNSL